MKARRNGHNARSNRGKAPKAKAAAPKGKAPARRRRRAGGPEDIAFVELLDERLEHRETSPVLSGGDVDADWQGAMSSGDEAVGGSSATPDQDVVDEIGRALGVEQGTDEEVHTSAETLRARDRDYWRLEREAAEDERS